MASFLHLIKGDSSDLAAAVVASNATDPDARVTVVLLEGAVPPALPDGVAVHRVDGDLDYAGLLELIFAHDHVITW